MEIYRTALGEGHPHYATSLNNMAEVYRETGRHGEAEPLYRQAVANFRATPGTSRPSDRTVWANYLLNQQKGGLPVPGVTSD
jgi:hypothetical protein